MYAAMIVSFVQENSQYIMYTPFDPLMFVAHKVYLLLAISCFAIAIECSAM